MDAALSLDGMGNLSGRLDRSSCMAESPNNAVNGMYSSDANGRGSITATILAPGGTPLRVVSLRKIYVIVPFTCATSGVGIFEH